MDDDAARVLAELRHAGSQTRPGGLVFTTEAVIGTALRMPYASVRKAAHALADRGLVRIREGLNYELYELVKT
ncbi:MAG: hypothetical protein LUC24_04690 [Bacteroidales bacterium]|nr:hypothetical protein [Bacteroidales bacterium]